MTLARTILKTAAIGAALMSSSSAFAQWAGEWTINGTNSSFIQFDNYVSGQMGPQGIIQGVLSPDKKILRGVFRRGSTRQTIELKLNGDEKFVGGIVSFNGGYPIANTRNIRWNGQLKLRRTPADANNSGQQSFLSEQSRRVQGWIRNVVNMRGAATISVSRPTAVVQAPEADTYPIEGNWSVTVQGAEYGPLAARRMVLQFTNPDSNGLVVGRAPGKPLVMIGKRAGNSGFRGIWMETAGPTNFSTTGRWGVVQASSYRNANGSGMDARFSVGYRLPLKQVSNPAVPGMRARGSHLGGGTGGGWPSARILLNAWDQMVAKDSPYPAIHGIWPTSAINGTIQRWIANDRIIGNFGSTQNVDLCAAKCMGKEPRNLLIRMIGLRSDNERKVEIYGDLDANAAVIKSNGRLHQSMGIDPIFGRARSNSIKRDGTFFMYVSAPTPTTPVHCYTNQPSSSLGQANFKLPALAWSDPTLEIKITPSGQLFEKDIAKRADDGLPNFIYGSTNVKASWQQLATAPGDTADAGAITATTHPDAPCFAKWGKAADDKWPFRGTSADFKLMTWLR